jgi:exodeoxyribonuclease-5
MEYSLEQDSALKGAAAWLKAPFDRSRQIYRIFGYAGVGKTTIAKELAQQCDGTALFAAYTGKAAYVMRSKGCVGCTTIHSLIYKPAGESKSEALRRIENALADLEFNKPKDKDVYEAEFARLSAERDRLTIAERRKPLFSLNMDSDLNDADVLIIDECSMVDEQMGTDLLSFGKKILVLGDPMQLPPVGSGGFFTDAKPDHLLTEIHRHAKESGILRFATDVRLTGGFSREPGHYGGDCRVGHKSNIEDLQRRVLEADQILVGKNATRHICNARIRELTDKGPGLFPIGGDKVVCLRNNHKQGLLNGSLWRVHEAVTDEDAETVDMVISSEEDGGNGIPTAAWTHHFVGREDQLKLKRWNRADFNEFDFGYALTVHKAQGSQWDDVVLFDESGVFRADKQRWLYTGVTRAAKNITVVL